MTTLSTTVPEYPSTAEIVDRWHLLLRGRRREEEEEETEREPQARPGGMEEGHLEGIDASRFEDSWTRREQGANPDARPIRETSDRQRVPIPLKYDRRFQFRSTLCHRGQKLDFGKNVGTVGEVWPVTEGSSPIRTSQPGSRAHPLKREQPKGRLHAPEVHSAQGSSEESSSHRGPVQGEEEVSSSLHLPRPAE